MVDSRVLLHESPVHKVHQQISVLLDPLARQGCIWFLLYSIKI